MKTALAVCHHHAVPRYYYHFRRTHAVAASLAACIKSVVYNMVSKTDVVAIEAWHSQTLLS